jgi:Fe2+ transport system protein B
MRNVHEKLLIVFCIAIIFYNECFSTTGYLKNESLVKHLTIIVAPAFGNTMLVVVLFIRLS